MNDRGTFLRSRFDSDENNFNLRIPIQPQHSDIFKRVADRFKPAAPLTDDIRTLVTDRGLNLCKNKTILIHYVGDALKLNTLNFYLLMNFLSNWKPYNEYVSSLVNIENPTRLGIEFTSLAELTELRFKEDSDSSNLLARLYNVDILYITIAPGRRLFDKEFAAEVLKLVVSLRNHNGLVTIINYFGTEKSFKDSGYEPYFIDLYLKRYSIGDTTKTNIKTTKKATIKSVSDEEVF